MKTIIVATDFSSGAINAAKYSANFAAATEAKIILFHIYHVSIHALNGRAPASLIDNLINVSKNKLTEYADKLSKDFNIEVSSVWSMGDFGEELQNTITSSNADIVVMGMASRSIEQDLLGNTTTAAVQSLKFPILAIPPDAEYRGLNTILLAYDITRGIHKTILEKVKDVAIGLGATIEVFHAKMKINQIEDKEKEISIQKTFEEGLHGTNYYYQNVESTSVIETIQDEITKIKADLLIMVPYKYGFWGSMVHRSKTRIMASRSKIPLLSLPL